MYSFLTAVNALPNFTNYFAMMPNFLAMSPVLFWSVETWKFHIRFNLLYIGL